MGQPVQVVTPTYRRPGNIARLRDQIAETSDGVPLFVVHATDAESMAAAGVARVHFVIDESPPSGVNATNAGFRAATSEWVVIGQDDFRYIDGWLAEAQRVAEATGAMVVGLNDLFPGRDAQQISVGWLVNRAFVMEHGLAVGYPGHIFCPEYRKNFADDELCQTAKARGVWAYAQDAIAEHLHPFVAKARPDLTYTANEAFQAEDEELFLRRRPLWVAP